MTRTATPAATTAPAPATPEAQHTTAPMPSAPASLSAADAQAWQALSDAMTGEVAVIADRDDLTVTIAPGAAHGAPACFLPAAVAIEVDGAHLEVPPATAAPDRVADRYRYPTVWGLLVHECAHAAHSTWRPPPGAPAGAVDAADLLEESRIEAAQVRRRPDDRHWLRASATNLILHDAHLIPAPTATQAPTAAGDPVTGDAVADPAPTEPPTAPVLPPTAAGATADPVAAGTPPEPGEPTTSAGVVAGLDRARAVRAAALLLGRVDAGILTESEVEPFAREAAAVLGAEVLDGLRRVWRDAHEVADDDGEAMVELGRRWCAVLGVDPDTAPATPAGPVFGPAPVGVGGLSALTEAIRESCGRVRIMVAAHPRPVGAAAQESAQQEAERAAGETAERAGRTVFGKGVGGPRGGETAIAGTRAPTDVERAAARALGRELSTAGIRDRVVTRTASVLPPGRLRMRGALAADAQRAAGAVPTAEPFMRTTRRAVPAPPLRLGVACDVSGSMNEFAGPVASAAWILAHAAEHATVEATTATVIFGRHVRAMTRPGTAPVEVTEFAAADNWEAAEVAIDALDHAVGLSTAGAARLLVIVSDGRWRTRPAQEAQAKVDRLIASGCAVLWLAPADDYGLPATPLRGVTVHPLTDPTVTATAIGRAATAALRAL